MVSHRAEGSLTVLTTERPLNLTQCHAGMGHHTNDTIVFDNAQVAVKGAL